MLDTVIVNNSDALKDLIVEAESKSEIKLEGALKVLKAMYEAAPADAVAPKPAKVAAAPAKVAAAPKPAAAAAASKGKIKTLGKDTVVHLGKFNGLLRDKYELEKEIGKAKLLMVDIENCSNKIYPIVFNLAANSKQVDLLEFVAKAISTLVTKTEYSCVKGKDYKITIYDDTDRYIYMQLKEYKIPAT